MKELEFYLKQAVEHQASDLFFVAGGFVSEKQDGIIKAADSEKIMPEDTEKLVRQLYKMADRSIESYLQKGDDDFSLAVPGLARFRVNT
ncbi:MAG: type IV pili twitching motility protein PilT, partial [Oscillospiraceae bacterium]|nr:type IV pili twitching motility protein PilT [Oscillospiraceae bacterium]